MQSELHWEFCCELVLIIREYCVSRNRSDPPIPSSKPAFPPTEGFSCLPTKFDSALVETPNKSDLIQTVAACELKESCYRIPFIEYYYEIVHHADGVKEERLKVGAKLAVKPLPLSPLKYSKVQERLRLTSLST